MHGKLDLRVSLETENRWFGLVLTAVTQPLP